MKKKSLLLLIVALFSAVAVPAWAMGMMPTKMMDIYMDSIYANAAAEIADFSKAVDMTVTSGEIKVALPAVDEDAISISREMDSGMFNMQVSLPSANEKVTLLADKAVYEKNGYMQAVQVADNDIHIVTTLLNDKAQKDFAYDFALPDGAYMEYADYGTDNSVLIYNEAGQAVYTLVPGIAKDANGNEVDFVWDLQGDTLVYGIADGQELSYPVNMSVNTVAAYDIDYYFSEHSIADDIGYVPGTSVQLKGKKISLKPVCERLYAVTTPSGFSSHKAASWSAVYDTYYSSTWRDLKCMKSQYDCHYSWCSVNGIPLVDEASCETWDLETWRTGTATPLPPSLGGNACNPSTYS